jgi:Ca-activated chloride channel family protein
MRMYAAAVLAASLLFAQNDPRPVFRADVRMVALPFSVTDSHGKAIRGLRPADFRIFEDDVPQRIAAFFEGETAVWSATDNKAGASIFILFDTSNCMYRMFPYVYDAIADFVRRLDPADAIAIYTFSRNLSRAARLTSDHALARAGMNNIAAGDDTALFNALLLTLRDAALVPGRKAVVMFSNGPDNASMVGPADVGRVAENEGIPVYIVSTLNTSKEPLLAEALQTLATRSGGKVYWASRWQDQASAFESVRQDIRSSYTAYYYPSTESAAGYRSIQVKITAPGGARWHVRARAGYEARPREPSEPRP